MTVIATSIGTYCASNGWEIAYAERLESIISLDRPIRIDTYKPFWRVPQCRVEASILTPL